ncbi:MAG: TlpA family protein disulfide reductase [Woeseia sp.]|nr:TlpA family protein disulfide reductase [Woeseia sp.]NNL54113.1 TlpA family protein disulfide reductase [Woeseia sp.]
MMNSKLLVTAVVLLALLGGFLLRQSLIQEDQLQEDLTQENTTPPAAVETSAARVNFTLPDLAGVSRDFAEWDGQARIVNFWATWCAPCRREIPLLKKTQSTHGPSGLQVIGIAVDFTEDVIRYAEEADFNYPILVGQEDAMAVAESSGVEFIGLPFTMIVAPGGDLLGVHLGEIHEPQMDSIVDHLDRFERGEITVDKAREALRDL